MERSQSQDKVQGHERIMLLKCAVRPRVMVCSVPCSSVTTSLGCTDCNWPPSDCRLSMLPNVATSHNKKLSSCCRKETVSVEILSSAAQLLCANEKACNRLVNDFECYSVISSCVKSLRFFSALYVHLATSLG